MRQYLALTLLLVSLCASAKPDLRKIARQIVEDGTLLYRSELASWHGTDILMNEDLPNWQNEIGGYFSYPDGSNTKCIFYRKEMPLETFATITFDSTFNPDKTLFNDGRRDLTEQEMVYYNIAKKTGEVIKQDSFFSFYQNSSLNIIPVIDGKKMQAYIITGTTKSKTLPLGNDYLLTFDDKLSVKSKERIHNSYLPFECMDSVISGIHTHLPGKSNYMTPTDICTMLLYQNACKCESYVVVSKKYVSIWSQQTRQLVILPSKTAKGMWGK